MSSPLKQNTTIIQELLNTINNLPEAGSVEPVLQEKTVTPTASSQTIKADSGYDGLDTVTVNAMPTATQATPSITVNASGLITATATQTAGYVAAGSKSATKQLAFQPAKTITPSTTSQIAVSSGYYTGGNITVAGDSDLVAENIKSGVNIFGVTGTYVGSGGSGGDTSAEDGLIDRTCSVYTNDRVTSIGRYAFGYCSSLTSVSFPAATRIGDYAFYSCSNLTSVSFPAATTIYSYAFGYCSSLTSVSFPKVTYIYSYAFYGCSSLTSVNFPAATYISPGAFGGKCSRLISVNFPVATTISDNAFYGCSGLISVNFPKVRIIGNYAF